MSDSAKDTDQSECIADHQRCPVCGYDWYFGRKGACPECGLPNDGPVYDEYAAGRRPAPLEVPGRSWAWAFIRTLASRTMFGRLARHVPPTEARRFCSRVFVSCAVAYVLLAFLRTSLTLANSSDGTTVILDAVGRGALRGSLTPPGPPEIVGAIWWSLPHLVSIVAVLFLVRWRCTRRLYEWGGLERSDAERVFAYSSPWLAYMLISWDGAWLTCVAALAFTTNSLVIALIWLAIVGSGWTMWRRALGLGVKHLRGGYPDRKFDQNVSWACFAGAVVIWIVCHLAAESVYVVVVDAIGRPDLWENLRGVPS